jgi:hypothetical protein
MKNAIDVTGGKPIAVLLQSVYSYGEVQLSKIAFHEQVGTIFFRHSLCYGRKTINLYMTLLV